MGRVGNVFACPAVSPGTIVGLVQGWFYLDRASGGNCDYRNSCGHAFASTRKGQG
jgi:hypothetical protein